MSSVTAAPSVPSPPTRIRFGLSSPGGSDLGRVLARARWAEEAGFSTFSLSDHLNAASPFITLQAVAGATSTIRLGTLVVNNDLRHPAVLAQDAATLDCLSGGRLELGLGAGWARPEYLRAGMRYDRAGVRVDRLKESVIALRALFGGETVTTEGAHLALRDHFVVPRPAQGGALPLLIGGNGDRVLALAAEHADIVGFTGFSPDHDGHNVRSHSSRAGLADRVGLVRRHSSARPSRPELQVLLQMLTITEDRELLANNLARRHGVSLLDVLSSPFLAFGTLAEVAGQITRLRDDFGITYVTVFDPHAEDAARVRAALGEDAV